MLIILKKNNYDVTTICSGDESIDLARNNNFDLIFMDLHMPGLDGYELCALMRATPGGSHVPIVMMTGLEDGDSIERAFAIGATEFCIKPLNWTLLPRHLRFILKASE